VTAELTRQVAQVCARFPPAEGPPTAPLDDLLGAADRLPERAAALRRLSSDLAVTLAELPGILRHGDLWSGNLLVDRRWLSGLIDWDAAHPAGVPGADLLQLVATDARRRAHQDLGQAFRACPWRSDAYRVVTADYWPALQVSPHGGMIEAAGIAWWGAEVHHTLVRLPHRAADERWIARNVDAVLEALGY
jgi:aminoglycoside phosphotransferase (APT) family kinase protein